MAGSVNKAIIVGNLGRDPEIRTFNNGGKVCNLRVATSETWRDKASGERRERTEWHSVVIFNEHILAFAEQYLLKGAKVYIEGQIETRKVEASGTNPERYFTEVVLRPYRGELTILSNGKDAEADGSAGGPEPGTEQKATYADAKGRAGAASSFGARQGFQSDLDDEIPF